MRSHAVGIVGVGAVTPLGHTFAQIADALFAGQSGVRTIDAFDVADHPSRIAGLVREIPCPEGFDPAAFAPLEPTERATLHCAVQALRDAGHWGKRSSLRIGVTMGNAAEWEAAWERDAFAGGERIYRPERGPSAAQRVVATLGLSGPSTSLSSACASGNSAIAMGRRWIELGWVDVCLVGAVDMAVTPMTLAGFGNLRALSRRNDDPARASRPFDQDRDGFVMGEGGALFVLERLDRARRRGAKIYAEVAGCGASSDAYHMVIPSPEPGPAIACMRQALADAEVAPDAVDYVNAHATSTPVGDVAEAKVLSAVFGPALANVSVSSTKSMTGHLLTGAAAVEALACLAALERQAAPPTINLERPDPECPLRHVPNQAEPRRLRVAVSNSFGFGGSNTCLVLRAA